MTKIFVRISVLVSCLVGASVASAQVRTGAACDATYLAGSCEERACQIERGIQNLDVRCDDPARLDRQRAALQAQAANLAGLCLRQLSEQQQALIDWIQSPGFREAYCAGERQTSSGGVTITPPPRRPGRTRTPPRDRTPSPAPPPRQPERQAVVCHSDLGAVSTADGQSCQCRQERYLDGVPVVGVLVNIPQRFGNAQHFGCPTRSRDVIDRILRILQQRAEAQDARDRAQDASIRRAQGTGDQALDRANDAHDIAVEARSQRPSSIEERFHIDLRGVARLVIPGQVGGGAPIAGGTGLGLRFRWRCNVCGSRDEFYFAVAGGMGLTGNAVGMTAYGETGIGYIRYLDRNRAFALSFGAVAYGFGLMGQEAAPTEPGLHGDLRRWGVGGEFLFDISLTGGSRASRPNRTEVRLQLGFALTYDTAFWWSSQAGLMQSQGFGFAPSAGLLINP